MFHAGGPLSLQFGCVDLCTVAVALCCVSTRHDVAENTHWFSVPFSLSASSFFSIWYNIFYRAAVAPQRKHTALYLPTLQTVLSWPPSVHTHTHKQSAAYNSASMFAIWIEMSDLSLPTLLQTADGWEIVEECLLSPWYADEPVQAYSSTYCNRSETSRSSLLSE